MPITIRNANNRLQWFTVTEAAASSSSSPFYSNDVVDSFAAAWRTVPSLHPPPPPSGLVRPKARPHENSYIGDGPAPEELVVAVSQLRAAVRHSPYATFADASAYDYPPEVAQFFHSGMVITPDRSVSTAKQPVYATIPALPAFHGEILQVISGPHWASRMLGPQHTGWWFVADYLGSSRRLGVQCSILRRIWAWRVNLRDRRITRERPIRNLIAAEMRIKREI